MEPIDSAFEAFRNLRQQLLNTRTSLATEADVRVKVIDPVFVHALGWAHAELLAEDKALNGFIDYNFRIGDRARLIVEAKSDGKDFNLNARSPHRGYKLDGPVFHRTPAAQGIQQAVRYCGTKNAELACVTNGREWIIFRGNRLGDGLDTTHGMAFVFPSLEDIEREFALFHDLLARDSVANYRYRPLFQEVEGRRIRSNLFARSLIAPGTSRLQRGSELTADIDRVMMTFFDRLTGDDDPTMLVDCFVETDESRAADIQLARVSEDIISRLRSLSTADAEALTKVIERAAQGKRHEFVVIVGTKGAGKTTFITRFFKNVLKPDLAAQCVSIRVNLANSPGDSGSIVAWLDQVLLREAESAIFGVEPPSFEELEGMFFDDYVRLRKGSWARLYESNKIDFQIKFGEWVEDKRERDPHDYINKLIRHVVANRKKLPVVVFDNADHFDIEFQERVYQYARSIYEHELSLIIVPITDRTSWRLSRHGALQSFDHEALFLPTPPTEQVLRKRVKYLNDKVDLERIKPDDRYFVKQGITWKLDDLAAFVRSLQDVFLNTAEVSRNIGRLSNHDVRRALKLARSFVTSPHLQVEDLLKAHIAGSAINVSRSRAVMALVRGNYRDYVPDQHEFVRNLYGMCEPGEASPLLASRVLQLLVDVASVDSNETLIPLEDVIRYFQDIGAEPQQVLVCLDEMLKNGLIRDYDPTITSVESATQVEVAPAGEQHLDWAKRNFEYVSAMADVTLIASGEWFEKIREATNFGGGGWRMTSRLFLEYVLDENRLHYRRIDHPSYAGQVGLRGALATTIEDFDEQIRKYG